MVIRLPNLFPKSNRRREAAVLLTELVVAIAFLCIAVLPLAFSFAKEHQYLRVCYQRAIAMEIVDGEMELLVAGAWREYPNGLHTITTPARAVTNLPPGKLQLNVNGKQLRLEWLPAGRDQGGRIIREVTRK